MSYLHRSDNYYRPHFGFTFIELVIVIALVSILAAATTPFASRFLTQIKFDDTIEKVVSTIRKAQEYAVDNKNNTTWGVCINSSNIRLYSNSCGSPTYYEDFAVPSSINVTGLNTITFSKRGEPSAALNITISSAIESKSITLNNAGGLIIN